MKQSIREIPGVRLLGRFDKNADGLPLNWSGSGFELKVKGGSFFSAEMTCEYHALRPYVSFIVDGLTAQTLSPLPGTHVYPVFHNLSKEKTHTVRVLLETQLFPGDARLSVHAVETDGEILPPEEARCRIEFIGDSITSGEGCRGPRDFQEWVPMMFSSSNDYTYFASAALKAEASVVSQSGWGAMVSWNNDLRCNMPAIYEQIAADGKPYPFDFDPDYVVVALGTNDRNALQQQPFTDPDTGKTYKFEESDMPLFEACALSFLKTIHERNPRAKIIWISFFEESSVTDAVRRAVAAAAEQGIPAVQKTVIDIYKPIRGGMGSRSHPGVVSQKIIARELVKAIKAL